MTRHARPPRRRRLLTRYGWRACTLCVLVVLTVVALMQNSAARGSRHADRSGARGTAPGAIRPGPLPSTVRVETDDGNACADNEQPQLALVSLHEQHAWMCEAQRQVYSTPVTTGATADGDQTPTGRWTVQSREQDRYLTGPGYRDYVHYWVPFNGDFGFHDATWQTMPFGSPGYTTRGSHGCVHLPMPAMGWFYDWSLVGITVVRVEA